MKGKPATMSSSFLIWGSATAMLAALVVACTGGHSTEVPMSDVPVSASEVPATAVDSPVVGEGARYWVQSDPFVGMYDAGDPSSWDDVYDSPGPAVLEIDGRCLYLVHGGERFLWRLPRESVSYDPDTGILEYGGRWLRNGRWLRSGDVIEGAGAGYGRLLVSNADEMDFLAELRNEFAPCTRMTHHNYLKDPYPLVWSLRDEYLQSSGQEYFLATRDGLPSDNSTFHNGVLHIKNRCAYAVIDGRRYLIRFPARFVGYRPWSGILVTESGDFVRSGDAVVFRGELTNDRHHFVVYGSASGIQYTCITDGSLLGHVAQAGSSMSGRSAPNSSPSDETATPRDPNGADTGDVRPSPDFVTETLGFVDIDGRCAYFVRDGKRFLLELPTQTTTYHPEGDRLTVSDEQIVILNRELVRFHGTIESYDGDVADADYRELVRLLGTIESYDGDVADADYRQYLAELRLQHPTCTRMSGTARGSLAAPVSDEDWDWIIDHWSRLPLHGVSSGRPGSTPAVTHHHEGQLDIGHECAYAVIDGKRFALVLTEYFVEYDPSTGILVAESGDLTRAGDTVVFRGRAWLVTSPSEYRHRECGPVHGMMDGSVSSKAQ